MIISYIPVVLLEVRRKDTRHVHSLQDGVQKCQMKDTVRSGRGKEYTTLLGRGEELPPPPTIDKLINEIHRQLLQVYIVIGSSPNIPFQCWLLLGQIELFFSNMFVPTKAI